MIRFIIRSIISILVLAALALSSSCTSEADNPSNVQLAVSAIPTSASPLPSPTPAIPNLQSELTDTRHKTTTSPIGNFDFQNYSYALPRGWENRDGSEIVLVNGRVEPISADITEDMTGEEKAEARAIRRIGLSYVTTKYFDATGDGEDEAVVILKIETGGAAIPQVVYVFTWKDGKPELIWPFRTGDRADGGLKDIRMEGGLILVELYGQDRFLLGQTETGKITGDEEQLCCPTHFTRTAYKWNGNAFQLQGKRLTFSVVEPASPPLENYGDVVNAREKNRK